MGSFSLVHWLIVMVVILVLFGRGKISETMGDFGKGLREFKRGMNERDDEPKMLARTEEPPRTEATRQPAREDGTR